MNNKLYILATLILAATSCSDSDQVQNILTSDDRHEIQFSIGNEVAENHTTLTRADFPTGTQGFTAPTRIVMRMESTKNGGGEKKFSHSVATAAVENCASDAPGFLRHSHVDVEHFQKRYWDDTYARDAQITIFAIALPNVNDEHYLGETLLPTGTNETERLAGLRWGTNNPGNSFEWHVSTEQTATNALHEDLAYSNNIKVDGTNGRYVWNGSAYVPDIEQPLTAENKFSDGVLRYSNEAFDKGHLHFQHALTRLTIHLIEGEGFDKPSPDDHKDFKFSLPNGATEIKNIHVYGMPTRGNFNPSTGVWSSPKATNDIGKLCPVGTTYSDGAYSGEFQDANGYYQAQVVPGKQFRKNDTTPAFTFTIDDNTYTVTEKQVFDALVAGDLSAMSGASQITMEQGKNYMLEVTLNKTAVANITASLEPWVNVQADGIELDNAHVTLSMYSPTGDPCEEFDLYRLPVTADKIYTDDADSYVNKAWNGTYEDYVKTSNSSLTKADDYATTYHWNTTWYYESNKEFYHFRTVPQGVSVTTIDGKSRFPISSGAVATTDPHWGAPMITTATLEYHNTEENDANGITKEGYSSSIHKAIGATKSEVNITEMHMLSQVKVVLHTTTGPEGVQLYDDTKPEADRASKVTLMQFHNNGTVDMGTGFVRTTGSANMEQRITPPASFWKTTSTESNPYSWAVVPQAVSRGAEAADKIVIVIETPDGNKYFARDLSDIKVTAVSNDRDHKVNDAITNWLPGHTYTYHITLKKKEIDRITCTLTDWVDVEAADKELDLEN